MDFNKLFSSIAKKGMSNKENDEFLKRKFPEKKPETPSVRPLVPSSSTPSPRPTPPYAEKSGISGITETRSVSNYSYTETRKASPPAARPVSSPSPSSSSSAPNPAGGYGSLLSSIAKEGMQNKENLAFLQRKFPERKPSSAPRQASSSQKSSGITGLFSSMAQESIAFQESKKKGFVQSFGPTPRDDSSEVPINSIPPKQEERKKPSDLQEREVIWLSEIGKKDIPLAGGKGANLAEMFNMKLPVPPAFIVTAKAYGEFIEQTGLQARIMEKISKIDMENTAQLEAEAKEIQHMINSAQMPRHLAEEIIEAYDSLSIDPEVMKNASADVLSMIKTARESPFVAVRSSATTEDLEGASFAGQQETYLNIKGSAQLIEAVKKCWASLFTARATYYRSKRGFKHEESLIAVIVQKMVNSDKSGVTFTLNPTTNNLNEIVIEAVFGLGEGIVSGTIAPDRYVIDKNTMQIKERIIASKPIYITKGRTGATVAADLPLEKQKEAVLDTREILRLADYAKKTEEHYNVPQDMEWAIESGNVYIVQTRPVTTYKKEIKKIEVQGNMILDGLAASPGIASGKVRIIHTLEDLPKIVAGDVLVTEMTNPDMVVTMQKAAAIVTDEGGQTCIEGDAKILTNKGFVKLKDVEGLLKKEDDLQTLSMNSKTKKVEWKKIIRSMKRRSEALEIVPYLQEGKGNDDSIKITPDHRMITLEGANFKEELLQELISKSHKLFILDKIPSLEKDIDFGLDLSKLMYLSGAIFSDGHIVKRESGRPMRVKFSQKLIPEKFDFISLVNSNFTTLFNTELRNYVKEGNIINGSGGFGNLRAASFECSRAYPAQILDNVEKNIIEIMSSIKPDYLQEFLAGFVDGDGHFNKEKKYLEVYLDRKDIHMLEAICIACLRLGISPSVRTKKSVYCIILNDNISQILQKCKRVKGRHKKVENSKLFSAKQLIEPLGIKDWRGNLWKYVKEDNLIGINKLVEYLKGHCDEKILNKIESLQNSDLRMRRIKCIKNHEKIDVYNITVEAESSIDHNYVIFTKNYTPMIVGNCHAAIVSREVGLPAVVGTRKATKVLHDGQLVTVDAYNGRIYEGEVKISEAEKKEEKPEVKIEELALPEEMMEEELLKEIEKEAKPEEIKEVVMGKEKVDTVVPVEKIVEHREEKFEKHDFETVTKVYMNLSEPEQIDRYKELPFDGIGLMRLEFMIASWIKKHPLYAIEIGEEEKYISSIHEGVLKVAKAVYPKPVIVRFSDFKSNEYKDLEGGDKYEFREANPMIGFRGVSRYISEEFEKAFRLECKALNRAKNESKNIWVMLPFVRTTDEVAKCLEIMKSENLERNENFKIFLMAEVPSMALIPEEFARLDIDGVSIGSNDLTQLVLGVDRDSAILGRKGYFNERNKAVLVAIYNIIKGFKKHQKRVSICGQAPSVYPEMVEFLIKQGIDSMSINPDAVSSVRKHVAETEKRLLLEAARKRHGMKF